MQKPISLFLALALLCSLCACAAPSPTEPESQQETPYTVTDILISQAITMAQQISLCAQPSYMRAIAANDEVASLAGVFTVAAEAEPSQCCILTTDDPRFSQNITIISGQLLSHTHLACSSILSYGTLLYLPKTLSETTVIYLRYSDDCHLAVVFVPGENKIVSATVYPLFREAAEALLNEHFADAKVLNATQIQNARKAGVQASVCATPTGVKTNAAYYTDLAKSVFTNVTEAPAEDIAAYIDDETIIARVKQMSRALTLEPFATAVYRFPNSVRQQINDILMDVANNDQLQQLTQHRIYLSYPTRYSATFGTDQVLANSVIHLVTETQTMGITALEEEAPVIAILGFTDELSVIVCISPGENNLYSYSYACLPCSFEDVTDMMEDGEAERLQ